MRGLEAVQRVYVTETREAHAPARDSTRAEPPEIDADTAVLSHRRELVERTLSEHKVNREERIDRLRREYQAGAYRPTSAELARFLIDEWTALQRLPTDGIAAVGEATLFQAPSEPSHAPDPSWVSGAHLGRNRNATGV